MVALAVLLVALRRNTYDYYFRQLWDWGASVDVDNMVPEASLVYAKMCGWAC